MHGCCVSGHETSSERAWGFRCCSLHGLFTIIVKVITSQQQQWAHFLADPMQFWQTYFKPSLLAYGSTSVTTLKLEIVRYFNCSAYWKTLLLRFLKSSLESQPRFFMTSLSLRNYCLTMLLEVSMRKGYFLSENLRILSTASDGKLV